MTTTIKDAMDKAEMDAIMVMEGSSDYDSAEALAAWRAIGKAEKSGNAVAAYNARLACEEWINKHENDAMQIINKRIAARAARAERYARPLTAEEIDKQLGM